MPLDRSVAGKKVVSNDAPRNFADEADSETGSEGESEVAEDSGIEDGSATEGDEDHTGDEQTGSEGEDEGVEGDIVDEGDETESETGSEAEDADAPVSAKVAEKKSSTPALEAVIPSLPAKGAAKAPAAKAPAAKVPAAKAPASKKAPAAKKAPADKPAATRKPSGRVAAAAAATPAAPAATGSRSSVRAATASSKAKAEETAAKKTAAATAAKKVTKKTTAKTSASDGAAPRKRTTTKPKKVLEPAVPAEPANKVPFKRTTKNSQKNDMSGDVAQLEREIGGMSLKK
ncbi:hypothetical protein EDC01DRAFT_637919 [Geopyxis carbonaria]|nr:hypothetical protein EDC01DRAFT_637919 [Geopyxis carbonaria]